ncbi:MAG TPA: methyltransferase domain-containing protein [Vicinamibacterales bacterium]|nr:methyltransferase domain-containing protein [Vicinamibacterales bacterium]
MTAADIIYGPLTPIYDVVCGALLQPGRKRAMEHLDPQPGERILEVGVGTGLDLNDYPVNCTVVAIDLSRAMMERAEKRLDGAHRQGVKLLQMDATYLAFGDATFDAVYVPYTINVVPDPIAAGKELVRVCRPHGRIVLLNHFDGVPETSNLINAIAGRLASAASVNWHLNLEQFLSAIGLRAIETEAVNIPRLSTVVVCEKL